MQLETLLAAILCENIDQKLRHAIGLQKCASPIGGRSHKKVGVD
jgi:hypothetical protein